MRIHERYPLWMRAYSGPVLSRLSLPIRYMASRVYGAYMKARNHDAAERISGRDAAVGAVIVSVGNIEAGGGGKTPCAIAIAEELQKRGATPVIVTRGYRSEAERTGPFVVTGNASIGEEALSFIEAEGLGERMIGDLERKDLGLLARAVGDEPLLFASRDIPTVIARDRKRGIGFASRLFGPSHIILDDAFQNRAVGRDLDILLLDWENPLGDGRLIPLGNLRELPAAVGRADCIIFTRAMDEVPPAGAEHLVAGKPVFCARHTAIDLVDSEGGTHPLEHLSGERVALFSGIARPESFEETVRSIGADPAVSFRFVDHHIYGRRDIHSIESEMEGCSCLVTTEKDMAKAAGLFAPGTRLLALRIRMEIVGIDRLIGLLNPKADRSYADPAENAGPSDSTTSS